MKLLLLQLKTVISSQKHIIVSTQTPTDTRALFKLSRETARHINMRLEFLKAQKNFTSSLSFLHFTAFIKT